MVGKSICFGLSLGSENVKNGSDIFLVSQVWSGDKILQIESNSEPITHVSSASSIMSGGEVFLESYMKMCCRVLFKDLYLFNHFSDF